MMIWPICALCLTCFEAYDFGIFDIASKHNLCPKIGCRNKMMFVRENFIPIVVELNKKGYYTTGCWSPGSSASLHESFSIEFQNNIVLPDNLPEGFSINIITSFNDERLPEGAVQYILNSNTTRITQGRLIPYNERNIEASNNIASLIMWVNELPNIKEE